MRCRGALPAAVARCLGAGLRVHREVHVRGIQREALGAVDHNQLARERAAVELPAHTVSSVGDVEPADVHAEAGGADAGWSSGDARRRAGRARGVTTHAFDEAWAAPGVPRGHYSGLLDAFAQTDVALLRATLNEALARDGVAFGEHPFEVCPVPRLLTAAEAAGLAAGLEQRVRALNAFVADAYGERRIVAAGRVPEWIIDSSDGFEPALRGRWPGVTTPIGVAGLDLVRRPDGELQVLEDNLRTPSGYAYAVAAARAVSAHLPVPAPEHDDGADALLAGLERAVRGASPRADPAIVVLTDGEDSSAHFEHALAARHLDAPLARPEDLVRDGDRLVYRDAGGRRQPVDVVYRRSIEDRLCDEHGALTPEGELLLGPWLAGEVALVNCFGTGVADDKLVHAYVEEMVRFHLGEDPLLRSVPTLDLTREENLDRLLAAPEEHVVKPRLGQGGDGVVVCADATAEDVRRCLDDVRERPRDFVAQPTITLSTHATVVGERLVPRHVDLRPFVFSAPGWTQAVPAGLTRVAWGEGAMVVNSSQDGGGKATWALRERDGEAPAA